MEPLDESLLLDRQLCFPLYAAARKVTGLYTPLLKPLGLTYTQYIALLALWERDGVTVGELCRRLRLDSGTLTPLLKRMEGGGLLTRSRAERDERVTEIRLTAAGKALKAKAAAIPGRIGRCVALAPAEAIQLYTLLYKVLGELPEGGENDE